MKRILHCLLFFAIFPIFNLNGFASTNSSEYVAKLKAIADQLDCYPLECHIFPLAQMVSWLSTTDFSKYFEFTTLAREATEGDCEYCISYLDEATPKERALILVVLFFSKNDKYLPLISKYLSDIDVAFTKTAYHAYRQRDAVRPDGSFPSCKKAPVGTYLTEKKRTSRESGDTYSELSFTDRFPNLTVSSFAAVILGNWGCFPDQNPQRWVERVIPPLHRFDGPPRRDNRPPPKSMLRININANQFSPEYWDDFYHRKKLLRSWYVKYLVEVCSYPIENYERKIIDFLEEVKQLSPLDCVLVFWRINHTPYTSFTDGDLFLTKKDQHQKDQYIFLQDWRFPYQDIPKEELIELLTMETLEGIDEWLSKNGWSFYDSMVKDILKRRNELFEKDEFEKKLIPRFNGLTKKCFSP